MNRPIFLLSAALVAAGTLAACDYTSGPPSARQVEQAAAVENQAKLNQSAPIPILPISQERENLVKRATRINVQNMTSCITLFSQNGVVVGFFPVNGKVSSLNSYLLSGEQLVDGYDGSVVNAGAPATAVGSSDNYTRYPVVMEQPDIDGAYGENADGIFFFTADTDAYVEWKGDYFWSDQCLTPSVQPLLVATTSADPVSPPAIPDPATLPTVPVPATPPSP